MAKLLYIQASPLAEFSYSVAVCSAFLETYRKANPRDNVKTLDLWEADLPEFGAMAARGKYAILHGRAHTEEERAAWAAVEAVIEQFKAADKYALAVPMWNFGIPYRLKHYIDIIVQPTYTFAYDPGAGYRGLVTGRPAFIAYARGGQYEGTDMKAFDHQKTYLEMILAFMGFQDIRSVIVEPTLNDGPEVAARKRDAAVAEARRIAQSF